jgi:hypothetical protein
MRLCVVFCCVSLSVGVSMDPLNAYLCPAKYFNIQSHIRTYRSDMCRIEPSLSHPIRSFNDSLDTRGDCTFLIDCTIGYPLNQTRFFSPCPIVENRHRCDRFDIHSMPNPNRAWIHPHSAIIHCAFVSLTRQFFASSLRLRQQVYHHSQFA